MKSLKEIAQNYPRATIVEVVHSSGVHMYVPFPEILDLYDQDKKVWRVADDMVNHDDSLPTSEHGTSGSEVREDRSRWWPRLARDEDLDSEDRSIR